MNIEKGVPFPEKPNYKNVFDKMEVGDSILFSQFKTTRDSCAYTCAKDSECRNGFKFKGRATSEGLRIWRVR